MDCVALWLHKRHDVDAHDDHRQCRSIVGVIAIVKFKFFHMYFSSQLYHEHDKNELWGKETEMTGKKM